MLRKRFQAKLLDSMTKHIKIFHPHLLDEFKKLVTKIYMNAKNGFYVRAPKQQFKSIKEGLQYILRYCGRPVFASSRIISIKIIILPFGIKDTRTINMLLKKFIFMNLSRE